MVWITRIDFAGFGNLSGEKLEFEERKLNLVLESDSVGKITVYGALWSTLYNFDQGKKSTSSDITDKERFAPFETSGLPYISGADLFVGSRYLKIIREFTEDAVQIVDMSKNNADVTAEFFTPDGTDQAGLKIVGMGREVFKRLSLVTSAEMSESRVGRLADLGRAMKEMLSGRPLKLGPEQALAAIDDALTFFPHGGKRLRGATVVRDLEGRFYELSDKVSKMEQERKSKGLSLEALANVPNAFTGEDQGRLTQYFDLCMECADIDTRLINAQETLLRVEELRSDLKRIGPLEYFPVELQKAIEELFTRRQSRQQDYESLIREYSGKIKEFDQTEKGLSTKYIGLDSFSSTDAQGISTLSREFTGTFEDLQDLRQRRRLEVDRLRNMGIDLQAFEELRTRMQALPAQDYEDARSYDAQIISSKKQIYDCEGIFGRERNHMVAIDRERGENAEKNKSRSLIAGVTFVVSVLVTVAVFILMHQGRLRFLGMALTSFLDTAAVILTIFFGVRFNRPNYFKLNVHKSAQQDMNAQTKLINELNLKVSSLEVKFDTLAHKQKFINGQDLTLRLREYNEKLQHLKELDTIDKTIAARELSLTNLRIGVEPYFVRAGRSTQEIRPDTTAELSHQINEYVDEAREIASTFGPITNAKVEMDFLASEIKETQKQLQASFIKAKMEHLHDYNESYREFISKVGVYQHWQAMNAELNRLENDMSSGFVPDELPPQIERLERARREKYTAMQDLITRSPNILELAPKAKSTMSLMSTINPYSKKAPSAVTKKNIESLKSERDGMAILVRSANTSDASYVLMLQELRSVQNELTIVRKVKTALDHARDRVVQAQAAKAQDWQFKLSEIMEEMLTQMGIEMPKYEDGLTDLEGAEIKTQPLSLVGKPFSLLTIEQVRWFARAIVVRVLALNSSFPLILNEPFGIGKESLRENNLPFIFSLLELRFQIMALTSEPNRFEAAYSAATAEQKMSLHTCARVSLG